MLPHKKILVHIENISHQYEEQSILKDFSLDIFKNESCAIVGPSWAWKTTLLFLIGGILSPVLGKIDRSPELLLREKHIGYWFVNWPFFEQLSLRENIFFLEKFTDISIDRQYYRYLLEYFELDMFADQPMKKLSVWQRDRVNIIRSHIHRPKLILLDEPGANLDSRLFDKLIQFIQKNNQESDTTYVVVAHNPVFSEIFHKTIHIH